MLAKRSLSQDEVSLEIDLVKMFGKKITDPALRRNIAESLIDIILKRVTEDYKGVTAGGNIVKLEKYSDEYIASDEFAAFDKKPKEVNMTLTGSMLASIDLISDQASAIKIGIDNEEAPKAYNHMVADTIKTKREFLGLTSTDIEKVKQEYKDQVGGDNPLTAADIFDQRDLARIAKIVSSSKKLIGFEP